MKEIYISEAKTTIGHYVNVSGNKLSLQIKTKNKLNKIEHPNQRLACPCLTSLHKDALYSTVRRRCKSFQPEYPLYTPGIISYKPAVS